MYTRDPGPLGSGLRRKDGLMVGSGSRRKDGGEWNPDQVREDGVVMGALFTGESVIPVAAGATNHENGARRCVRDR